MHLKPKELNYFSAGRRLTLAFSALILLIVGGNGLLIWEFRATHLQTDQFTSLSQELISVLRLQQSLLLFHQRLDELAQLQNAQELRVEAEPLRKTLLDQIQRSRETGTHLPDGTRLDPALLPTLDAIEITLPTELNALKELANSGDWDAVRLRLDKELKPLETQTSALVDRMDQQVSEEMAEAVENMASVQRTILVIVPTTAASTLFIATFLGWSIARRVIELRLNERLAERLRISRELHDTLLQTIQGSKLVADDALKKPDDHVRMQQAMEQLAIWLDQVMHEGRVAVNSLRTSTTQGNDLAAALKRATEECRMQRSIEVSFIVGGNAKQMHPAVRDEVYRIGYEAIRNACNHSGGNRLEVSLSYTRDLALRVFDNGVGIDPFIADHG